MCLHGISTLCSSLALLWICWASLGCTAQQSPVLLGPPGCRQGPSGCSLLTPAAVEVRSGGSEVTLALWFWLSMCPLEAGLAFIPEESLQLLFFLSAHTPMLLGQSWVFLPTSSCPLCAHAGKTIGCLVVCPLSLEGASCSQQQRLWSVLV